RTLAPLQRHATAMFRPERDERLRNDGMAGHETQRPLLCYRRDNQDQFHPRERLADALARTAAERKVRELRQRRLELRRPAVGIETIGARVKPRVAVRH